MAQTALILGPTGRCGRNMAEQFEQAGWIVRRFDRATQDLMQAARGADVIVNCWNPAYPDWEQHVPQLTRQVIAAARASGATIILPGNVYVFGASTPAPWSHDSAFAATNPLGRIRIEMEAAYRDSGLPCIMLRAGDYLDTQASGNWFDMIMIKGLNKGVFTSPGDPDLKRAWGFLPDVARAAVMLADTRASLPRYCDVSFEGYTHSAGEMAQHLGQITGQDIRVKRMSWLPIYALRPFWKLSRHLVEMRYLWDTAHRLDGSRLRELLPEFRDTPVQQALAQSIPSAGREIQIDPDKAVAAGL